MGNVHSLGLGIEFDEPKLVKGNDDVYLTCDIMMMIKRASLMNKMFFGVCMCYDVIYLWFEV